MCFTLDVCKLRLSVSNSKFEKFRIFNHSILQVAKSRHLSYYVSNPVFPPVFTSHPPLITLEYYGPFCACVFSLCHPSPRAPLGPCALRHRSSSDAKSQVHLCQKPRLKQPHQILDIKLPRYSYGINSNE